VYPAHKFEDICYSITTEYNHRYISLLAIIEIVFCRNTVTIDRFLPIADRIDICFICDHWPCGSLFESKPKYWSKILAEHLLVPSGDHHIRHAYDGAIYETEQKVSIPFPSTL
jgi:hypothetical protein